MEFSDALWRKSSFSGTETECVEVNYSTVVGIRDSKNPAGGRLAVPESALRGLVRRAVGRKS